MRAGWLILFALLLLAAIFRAESLLSSTCNNVLSVSLSQRLILPSQGWSALGTITSEEWGEQPRFGQYDFGICSQNLSDFNQGLAALWQREWELADSFFAASDRGVLTDMGSFTTGFLLDKDGKTMSAQTADYFISKGDIFLRASKPEIAEVYYRESVNYHPTIQGWLGLAEAYGECGRDQDARETWELVLELDPENAAAKRALEE